MTVDKNVEHFKILNVQPLNRIENNVAKGEIAHDEQFLLLQQCFKICLLQGPQKASVCGKGFIPFNYKALEVGFPEDRLI